MEEVNYDDLAEMMERLSKCNAKPNHWIISRDIFLYITMLPTYKAGNPPKVFGLPIVIEDRTPPDMIYLTTEELIKPKSHGKQIKLPKWDRARQKE